MVSRAGVVLRVVWCDVWRGVTGMGAVLSGVAVLQLMCCWQVRSSLCGRAVRASDQATTLAVKTLVILQTDVLLVFVLLQTTPRSSPGVGTPSTCSVYTRGWSARTPAHCVRAPWTCRMTSCCKSLQCMNEAVCACAAKHDRSSRGTKAYCTAKRQHGHPAAWLVMVSLCFRLGCSSGSRPSHHDLWLSRRVLLLQKPHLRA